MQLFYKKPLDQTLSNYFGSIDPVYKRAIFFVLAINMLAFGFEMTNLTMHHDDLAHIFIQDDILGHYLGRFGFGQLHYYLQNAYIMPFVQMLEGIILMSLYGVFVAHFWGLRNTLDIVVTASVICVFPYMGQIFQYNTSMVASSAAHLLAASALILSTRTSVLYVTIAALLYTLAFSIYQSVVANAATIFLIWAISMLLFNERDRDTIFRKLVSSSVGAIVSVVSGGLIYVAIVSVMDINFDSYQSAGDAFKLGNALDIPYSLTKILEGTRSFFLWPEHYFPDYLKKIQLVFLLGAGIICIWLPKNISHKLGAISILCLAVIAPRMLQILHPQGNFHNLTLTAYAVMIAGAVMIIHRTGQTLARNSSILLVSFLIAGYILQCNWISTVNYLNTFAHYSTLTQVLSRIRSLPEKSWDGKTIAVAGSYDMPSNYPYRSATGVATEFMDVGHMQKLADLMRDDVRFIPVGSNTPGALEYAANHPVWPHPESVAVVDGMGVVVLSK